MHATIHPAGEPSADVERRAPAAATSATEIGWLERRRASWNSSPTLAAAVSAVVLLLTLLAVGLTVGMRAVALSTHIAQPSGGTAAVIAAEDAWARAAARLPGDAGATSAVYLVLRNAGAEADRLLGATSDAAASTEIHYTTLEDGVMRMRPAGPVDLPAGGALTLQPGGLHVMLIGLQRDLVAGERLVLVLHLERAGDVHVDAEVRASAVRPMHGR